ncbi:uncharacterized protein LOC122292656 isoform X1 [Carya illinoinensis]|uniref:Uncharacterized protein n=1 Tax=Carya illinoinensis TaxID=32201 RepID=A0A8T1NRL7_CARIL|nr:uncharacterized protein LOC122292656 isoform X1 [Carya illinoinensis]KAG6631553.1 hypothetical protein CIPAW_13G098900 [Carya illinoinensis]
MYWPVDGGAAEEVFGLCFLLSILDIFVLRSGGKRSSQSLCFLPTVVCRLDHLDRFSLSCVVGLEEEMPVGGSPFVAFRCVLALLLILFCCGLPWCKRKSSFRGLYSLLPCVFLASCSKFLVVIYRGTICSICKTWQLRLYKKNGFSSDCRRRLVEQQKTQHSFPSI